MKKGKLREEKKYLSILFVPHFTDKVKVLRFSVQYSKLLILAVLCFVLLLYLIVLTIVTSLENNALKNNVSRLSELNIEQKDLLNEKSQEIDGLKQRDEETSARIKEFTEKYEEETNARIKEFTEKYNEITNNYITSKINRSGDRNDRSFIDDINELKTLLGNMDQFKSDQNNAVDLSETENKLIAYIDKVPTLWPASGKISSRFADREDPFWFNSKFHSGIDIAAQYGQDIKASASGTVSFSGYKTAYGYVVFIDHGHGITTVYGHASRLIATEGQEIKKGDVIAKVGSSGRSTGPHLHFEVRINDNVVDPLKYLDNK